ncbi:ATP-binding protein [Halostagnicola sp. A-GB9-2]|uniref:ATP-binding protein n=1 Tax=Halostagnicola sp. A-GB9-2 TaxID=3048066 RepID=UPI0024C0E3A6|nr:ATP-binding protein [Halostagnicola sp. A-GB9-2]MDJ1432840.1 PAS domain-containing protein [Halostagnicola sp. A-GB9-2]
MGSSSKPRTELEIRVHQRELVTDLGTQALDDDDSDKLLEDAIDAITTSLNTEFCHVLETDSSDEQLSFREGVGWDETGVDSSNLSTMSKSLFGHTLRSDEPVIVSELEPGNRFSVASVLVEHDITSGITVSLGPDDDPWGILGTYSTNPRDFTEDDARFVENVASILTSALDGPRRTDRRNDDRRTDRILETSPVGITAIDADGTITFANDHAEDLLGGSTDQLPTSVLDESWEFADRDGNVISPDNTPFSRAKRAKEPVTEDGIGITQANGTRVWLSVRCAPSFDGDGSFDGAVCTQTDVTDRKELEGKLERILGRIDDAFCAFDDELRYTLVNDRAEVLLQHSEEELLGNTLWEMFPEASDDQDVRESFERAIETQEPTSYQHYYEPLGNWIEGNIYPSETGVSLYFRDITERKEYERKLERSNERLEQFAYAASHDLQEPLRMVTSYLNLIERRHGAALDEEGREFLEFAVDGAERMHEMIDGLLEYSRVETRGDSFDMIDLNDVFADARKDLKVHIEETDARITGGSLPCVEGDGNQLRQVFQNLLSNAMEYSGADPPQIDVSARRDGDEWKITVQDNGVGIDPSNEGRIFQVFQRFPSADDQQGSGIGLALCKRIVERHDGRIDVDSVPGEGSTFTITLPVSREQSP